MTGFHKINFAIFGYFRFNAINFKAVFTFCKNNVVTYSDKMSDSNFANPNRTRIAYLRAVWILFVNSGMEICYLIDK